MRSAAALLIILIALLTSAPAAAADQDSNSRFYLLSWVLGPHAISEAETWVREQGQILETRLLPTELYVADGPVTAADGTLLMASGQQVVRLDARKPIICNLLPGASGTGASRNRICLVDTNEDGRFDSYFHRGFDRRTWLLFGEVPNRLRPLVEPTFRAVSRESMIGAPILTLHYQRILDGLNLPIQPDNGSDMVRFHFEVLTTGRRTTLTRSCVSEAMPSYCASARFPSQFRFAGLVVDLLERRGETIKIRVVSPFDRRVVRVQYTGEIYYDLVELDLVENR